MLPSLECEHAKKLCHTRTDFLLGLTAGLGGMAYPGPPHQLQMAPGPQMVAPQPAAAPPADNECCGLCPPAMTPEQRAAEQARAEEAPIAHS